MSSQLADTDIKEPTRQTGFRILVIHHTHWDREWWATYQDFRFRLVETIDALLDTLDADPAFRSVLLDGQMIVLRDYLEVRPENQERLLRSIRNGRIECGPWYVLADEFLVSGEAHIRNLWLGRRTALDLEVPMLKTGYLPDTFGHVAQMPQILQGFGIDSAFIWRGRGGDPEHVKSEFLWQAPDGSEVLTYWFPGGYYQMPFLHFDNPDRPYEDKLGRVFAAIDQWGARATTDILLMPYGGDHRLFDPRLQQKIAAANAAIGELGKIEWTTLQTYAQAIHQRNPHLAVERGEMRRLGPDAPHLFPGVLSARLSLKRLNASCQTLLERYAEPLSALAWLRDRRYDAGMLWKAWELLVQNQAHDSICGCSIDEVHREMVPRFEGSRQIAQILSEKAAQYINDRIDVSGPESADRALVVHNTLPRSRTGWASVWIDRQPAQDISPRTHLLLDEDGREIPFQTREVAGVRPITDRWRHTEIGFVAEGVQGLGYHAYRLAERETPLDEKQLLFTVLGRAVAAGKGDDRATDLAVGTNAIENRWLRVHVDARDGTLTVTDKTSGAMFAGLNAFEDGGDAGDTYNYSAPLDDLVLHSRDSVRAHVSIVEAGYARATLRIDLDWPLPAALSEDRLSRSASYVETRISTFVSLASQSRCVEITTEWENRTCDHRLRALFPLGEDVDFFWTEGQFAVARRPTTLQDAGNGWPEPPVPQVPQGGWTTAEMRGRGLLIVNRGLPEVEVMRDGQGTIALTLLRAVGWLSRDDTLARVGGAGPTTPTPDAQALGRNRASYAIIPYAGTWQQSGAYLAAEEYLAPLYGSTTGVHTGNLPRSGGLLELEGEHTLLMSTCKKAEGTDALVVRFWNVAEERTEARIRMARRPSQVCLVDLKEEALEGGEIPVEEDGSFVVAAGPAKIVTVMVCV